MTEAGFSGAANTIMETITSSVSPEDSAKNQQCSLTIQWAFIVCRKSHERRVIQWQLKRCNNGIKTPFNVKCNSGLETVKENIKMRTYKMEL